MAHSHQVFQQQKKMFNWPKHWYTKIFKKQIGSGHQAIQQASKFQRRI